MESIIDYFSDMPTIHRTIALVGGITIFMLIESAVPLFSKKYNKVNHTALNIFFTLTTVAVNFALAFSILWLCDWVTASNFGLINLFEMPIVVYTIVGVMLLDFISAWLAHWTEHHVKPMWQFHVIHHTDQNVDTTTANRHHPGESVIRFAFTALGVFVVGAPIWMFFLYQSLSLVFSQWNHSNIKMPEWLDNLLVLVVCTPNMHRVHHHYRQPYSDKNYGNIFSLWDRIFGTYIKVDNSKLVYGVDTYMDINEAHNLGALLKSPFVGYREPIEYNKEEVL